MSGALVLIDTSAWIHVLRRDPVPALRDRLSFLVLENQAAVTEPIGFELLCGARSAQEADRLRTRLDSLHVFPFTEHDWVEAGLWAVALARKGVNAKSMDILISYKARRHQLALLHADTDFDRIARAAHRKVESWVDRIAAAS